MGRGAVRHGSRAVGQETQDSQRGAPGVRRKQGCLRDLHGQARIGGRRRLHPRGEGSRYPALGDRRLRTHQVGGRRPEVRCPSSHHRQRLRLAPCRQGWARQRGQPRVHGGLPGRGGDRRDGRHRSVPGRRSGARLLRLAGPVLRVAGPGGAPLPPQAERAYGQPAVLSPASGQGPLGTQRAEEMGHPHQALGQDLRRQGPGGRRRSGVRQADHGRRHLLRRAVRRGRRRRPPTAPSRQATTRPAG